MFDEHFSDGYHKVRLKHLKVVLLDLYVAWSTDPNLKVSYSRNVNDYRAGSIYNELNISKTTIIVVDRLHQVGLVNMAKGFQDRKTGAGRLSRMRSTSDLVKVFEQAAFSLFDTHSSPDRLNLSVLGVYGPPTLPQQNTPTQDFP